MTNVLVKLRQFDMLEAFKFKKVVKYSGRCCRIVRVQRIDEFVFELDLQHNINKEVETVHLTFNIEKFQEHNLIVSLS